MFRSFVKRGILLVFITAVILGIILFVFFNKTTLNLLPVRNGARLAYHEVLNPSDTPLAREEAPTDGALLGTLQGKEAMNLRYRASYAALFSEASLISGSLGGTENAYVRIINANVDKLGKTLTYSGTYGSCTYRLTGEEEMKGEAQVLSFAPDTNGALIIYCQRRGDVGLGGKYRVMIYEEAN